MIAAVSFGARDDGVGPESVGLLDGLNNGLWCQSALNVSGIGSWTLPDGNPVPDDLNAEPIHMANRPGQVGLLRVASASIGVSPYRGMYTCTIPDEHGDMQTLVVWAGGNVDYDSKL